MTLTTSILIIIILGCVTLIGLLAWYSVQAVRQIRTAEQYGHNLIGGIEELKELMQIYINHVSVVNELEMFYGDETLRELIRHGKSLVETFEDYKVDYFPILEMEEEEIDDERENYIRKETA